MKNYLPLQSTLQSRSAPSLRCTLRTLLSKIAVCFHCKEGSWSTTRALRLEKQSSLCPASCLLQVPYPGAKMAALWLIAASLEVLPTIGCTRLCTLQRKAAANVSHLFSLVAKHSRVVEKSCCTLPDLAQARLADAIGALLVLQAYVCELDCGSCSRLHRYSSCLCRGSPLIALGYTKSREVMSTWHKA